MPIKLFSSLMVFHGITLFKNKVNVNIVWVVTLYSPVKMYQCSENLLKHH